MDKEEVNKRLAAIESEAKELRAIINEPEQPEPKQGEVWQDASGSMMLITDDGHCYLDGEQSGDNFDFGPLDNNYIATRIGTFEEVYVKRSNVEQLL